MSVKSNKSKPREQKKICRNMKFVWNDGFFWYVNKQIPNNGVKIINKVIIMTLNLLLFVEKKKKTSKCQPKHIRNHFRALAEIIVVFEHIKRVHYHSRCVLVSLFLFCFHSTADFEIFVLRPRFKVSMFPFVIVVSWVVFFLFQSSFWHHCSSLLERHIESVFSFLCFMFN